MSSRLENLEETTTNSNDLAQQGTQNQEHFKSKNIKRQKLPWFSQRNQEHLKSKNIKRQNLPWFSQRNHRQLSLLINENIFNCNFTFDYEIRMPISLIIILIFFINHYSDPLNQQNMIEILWCYSILMYLGLQLALSTLITQLSSKTSSAIRIILVVNRSIYKRNWGDYIRTNSKA